VRIYLVRHPAPAVEKGICYGQTDLELVEDAAVSAAKLRNLLPAGAAVYSSPLRRCRDLAEALHPAPIFDDRLKEIHFGEWEMQAWDSIDRAAIDAWAAATLDHAPPGGESVAALYERVSRFIRERHAAHENNLILFTHAGVMKACCALLLNLPESKWMALPFDFGSVSLIRNGELLWHNRRDE
jgi:alpha-ribazole phosphatase